MPVIEIADWRSLASAPRDGTAVLVVVSPSAAFNLEGYVTIGRWVSPETSEGLSKFKRQLFTRYGGWWARGKNYQPFGRPVIAWMPIPFFDFDDWREEQGPDHG